MKKIWSMLLIGILLLTPCAAVSAEEAATPIQVGQYIRLGQYWEEPILWKCVDIEAEHGPLMLSDKILCYKAFDSPAYYPYGNSLWEVSNLRAWLNSSADAGQVVWPQNNPPNKDVPGYIHIHYDQEKGFLHPDNFTADELSVMKTVAQWTSLTEDEKWRATNGVETCLGYLYDYSPVRYSGSPSEVSGYAEVTPENYAMYKVTDTMFLLSGHQAYHMWQNLGTVEAEQTPKAAEVFSRVELPYIPSSPEAFSHYPFRYWTREPAASGIIALSGEKKCGRTIPSVNEVGVRPAFFLNTARMQIVSGSGTADDPYVVDGQAQTDTLVICNGQELSFDQQPVVDNGRLLVPVRTIFEALGAEVTWNEEYSLVTATRGYLAVRLQIGNTTMERGYREVELDAAPQLVGDRTLVPLRAVSEALGAKVEYRENLNRVVIELYE